MRDVERRHQRLAAARLDLARPSHRRRRRRYSPARSAGRHACASRRSGRRTPPACRRRCGRSSDSPGRRARRSPIVQPGRRPRRSAWRRRGRGSSARTRYGCPAACARSRRRPPSRVRSSVSHCPDMAVRPRVRIGRAASPSGVAGSLALAVSKIGSKPPQNMRWPLNGMSPSGFRLSSAMIFCQAWSRVVLVGPFDEGEDDLLVVLGLHRAIEVGDLALAARRRDSASTTRVAPCWRKTLAIFGGELAIGVGLAFGHRHDEAVGIAAAFRCLPRRSRRTRRRSCACRRTAWSRPCPSSAGRCASSRWRHRGSPCRDIRTRRTRPSRRAWRRPPCGSR